MMMRRCYDGRSRAQDERLGLHRNEALAVLFSSSSSPTSLHAAAVLYCTFARRSRTSCWQFPQRPVSLLFLFRLIPSA